MFNGTLYDPQKPAAAFLCNRKKALLAWEQGTGKTIISVAAVEKLFSMKKAKTCLVIAQSGSAWQWEDKIREFSDTRVSLVTAKNQQARKYLVGTGPSYTVTSWHLFRRDIQTILKKKWDIVILDEAQEIKNFNTKAAQYAKRLNAKCKPTYRWALTGTAISTKLEELYSILYWVDPAFLPRWPVFAENHLVRNDLGMVYQYKNLLALNEYLKGRVDRKTQHDMDGHMPKLMPPIVHTVEPPAKLLKAQEELLAALEKMAGNIVFDEDGNPQLKHDPKVAKAYAAVEKLLGGPEKIKRAARLANEILDENSDNRIVFFSRRKDPLYQLQEIFGPRAVLFTGDQDSDQKRANVEKFLQDGTTRILLCSNAGAAGLDLYTANNVINLDVPPSFGILDQRIKRITRLSSIHPTALVHFIVYAFSLELFLYQVVYSRGQLASGALEGTIDEVTTRPQSLRSFLKSED